MAGIEERSFGRIHVYHAGQPVVERNIVRPVTVSAMRFTVTERALTGAGWRGLRSVPSGAYTSTTRVNPSLKGISSGLSLIHISEPTRLLSISYAVFCLKK